MNNTIMAAWGILIVASLSISAGPAKAQNVGPSQVALDDAVQFGTIATLAPLCGMREEAWAFDLRRATILDATKGSRPDDPALRDAAGSALVVGALSFADAEALESFAEAAPSVSCGPLGHHPDLARADDKVRAFRAMKKGTAPES